MIWESRWLLLILFWCLMPAFNRNAFIQQLFQEHDLGDRKFTGPGPIENGLLFFSLSACTCGLSCWWLLFSCGVIHWKVGHQIIQFVKIRWATMVCSSVGRGKILGYQAMNKWGVIMRAAFEILVIKQPCILFPAFLANWRPLPVSFCHSALCSGLILFCEVLSGWPPLL